MSLGARSVRTSHRASTAVYAGDRIPLLCNNELMASPPRRPLQDQWANGPIVLVAFSNATSLNGNISASKIFNDLMLERTWYLPRSSRYLIPNETTIVFYQSGAGVCGYASVLDVAEATEGERALLSARFGLPRITTKVRLGSIQIFVLPVPLGPLAKDLQFVANKVHWGHSVRTSPRTINDADFALLKHSAASINSTDFQR
jgi:hypothetical protein